MIRNLICENLIRWFPVLLSYHKCCDRLSLLWLIWILANNYVITVDNDIDDLQHATKLMTVRDYTIVIIFIMFIIHIYN